MQIQIGDYLRYGFQLLTGPRTKAELQISLRRDRDISPYLKREQPLRTLDVANGRLRPQYTILKARGEAVVGIDRVNEPKNSATELAYNCARRIYSWKLGVPSRRLQPQALICGDVALLPFKKEQFSLVTSVAAFEHFLNVPGVIHELYRILKPDGIAWIVVHLFTCLSGGHNFRLAEVPLRTMPNGVDPWDHLRKRRLPFHVPLNEWRKHQYVEQFAQEFEILKEYAATREGEELLTPEIERELADYSRDELTCRSFVIVARKA